jgi:hypothetical protein
MAIEEMKFIHEHHSDVVHVILCEPPAGAKIDTISVGDYFGFPGLITARMDVEKGVLYGINIENYAKFKRTVRWQNHMLSLRKAVELIVRVLQAGMCIEHKDDHQPMYA